MHFFTFMFHSITFHFALHFSHFTGLSATNLNTVRFFFFRVEFFCLFLFYFATFFIILTGQIKINNAYSIPLVIPAVYFEFYWQCPPRLTSTAETSVRAQPHASYSVL